MAEDEVRMSEDYGDSVRLVRMTVLPIAAASCRSPLACATAAATCGNGNELGLDEALD